ncbi:tRNA pseudouridine(55) synthase TruB [Candidatus Microgenomates bacterium]|nr:tRNA pseudouridine(55) synthase TruB [Candidatus Microgenomates bacterium]
MKEGFLAINKPSGITSFAVVRRLRQITGVKKIGHAGTLDPLASGVLVCAIGRSATKNISYLMDSKKTYQAMIEFGKKSDTYDSDGKIEAVLTKKIPSQKDITDQMVKFLGEIKQRPPIFSAKKIKGKKAYHLARQGKKIILPLCVVKIFSIKVKKYHWPFLSIEVVCGKGTYIRSIANDLGEILDTGGVLISLIRTKSGFFSMKQAIDLEKITKDNWEKKLIPNVIK